jgi:hypothetical protein
MALQRALKQDELGIDIVVVLLECLDHGLKDFLDSVVCNSFFEGCVVLWVSSQNHKNANGEIWIT